MATHEEMVEPLCRVLVDKLYEEMVTEEDLNTEDLVTFKFLKQ